LRERVLAAAKGADAVVMAAAVADFRPVDVAEHKIKKSHETAAEDGLLVRLVRNPDILADLVAERAAAGTDAVIVGFAAETGDESGDVLTHARAKLARKGCDLLVVNDVSAGRVFGQEHNTVTLLRPDGTTTGVPEAAKSEVADVVWDTVAGMLTARVESAEPSRVRWPDR
jgi:phosphopantothenoylcysteine decarboxylase/phosphopantothenate--cysteine ligase